MYIIIYNNETMLPMYTAEKSHDVTLDFFKDRGEHCFESENGNIINKYVKDESLLDRKSFGYERNYDVSNQLVLNDVPEGTTIFLDNVEQGILESTEDLEIDFEEVGTYELKLVNIPEYLDSIITVKVGNEVTS